jgi:hypothetical protein
MISAACSRSELPNTRAIPCSLTMALCWKLVTGSLIRGTTVEHAALGCQDGSAM